MADSGAWQDPQDEEDDRAARYSDLFASGHDHVSDRSLCPICATIAVLRETKPEVVEYLATAARELLTAASILVDDAQSRVGVVEEPKPDRPTVRRIDVV